MAAHDSPRHLPDLRVLVVDDNDINREFLRAALSDTVGALELAGDGHQALARAREFDPHIVLMDLHMPGMDGLETWRRMRAMLDPVPRVIALTADCRKEERQRLLDAGFDDFLNKPVNIVTLLEHLSCLAAGRKPPATAPTHTWTGSSSLDARPLLDDARALAAGNHDHGLVRRLRIMLRDELLHDYSQLDEYLAQGGMSAACDSVHRLRGACGYVGAARLEQACAALETALAEEDAARVAPAYLTFISTLGLTRSALDHALSRA